MSSLRFIYRLAETQLDENDIEIAHYTSNLPHHEMIAEVLSEGWNSMHMENFFDGILKGKIESCVMEVIQWKGESLAYITIKPKQGYRLSAKRRDEIFAQLEGQITDGWGESYLDYSNIMTDAEGVRFFPE